MSYYREANGTIVVNKDCEHLVKEHIGFQMGTIRRDDGRLILLDHDLLSVCGKRVPRPHTRRPPRFKTALKKVHEDVMDELVSKWDEEVNFNCPRDKSKCKFWNDVFLVCAAKECVMKEKEKVRRRKNG